MKVQSLTKKFMLLLVCFTMLFTMSLLAGCKGDNGSSGANGATGATGPAGPVTTTNESCMVCHETGAVADVKVAHPDNTNKGLVILITNVTTSNGNPQVTFNVKSKDLTTGALANYTGVVDKNQSFKIADLIPAGTVTQPSGTVYGTDYYEMWTSETGSVVAKPACAAGYSLDSTSNTCYSNETTVNSKGTLATPATNKLDTTDKANGNYTYTFTQAWGVAWPGYNNADYVAGNTRRIAIEMSSTNTGYNKAVGIADFTGVPAEGVSATLIASPRQFATIAACQQCHGPLMDGAAHASSRNDLRECIFCHSALYGSQPSHDAGFMVEDNADLPVFIHKIHAAKEVPAFEERMEGYTAVTFPRPVQDCVICHSDPSGSAPGDLTGLDNWKTHPTARICSSCHTANTLSADGLSMTHDQVGTYKSTVPSGVKTNATCLACHGSAGTPTDPADIVTAHDTTATGNNVPEFDVTLSISDPANKAVEEARGYMGYFVSGETFTVNVTLKDHATGLDVDPAVYTTAKDAAYVSGGGLAVASLYVYGPRANAKPLTGTQANSLFGKGDATGFHYAVTVPATATAGTYMVRARIADYSWSRSNPTGGGAHEYQLESFNLETIQIGANVPRKTGITGYEAYAAPEKQVAGDGDTCKKCHGDTLMHAGDHAAPFDTDHCLSCHDQSGGHAAYIGNRVHAVHAASATGDMVDGRDWTEVTFPQAISTTNCTICHTSGATSYRTNVYENPCLGCHGDNPDTLSHMLQNGGKYQKAQ